MGLFTPVWKGKDRAGALAYIGKCGSQKTLAKIARESHNEDYALAAVKRLTDERYLVEFASMKYGFRSCALAAVEGLRDQKLLFDAARTSGHEEARVMAAQRLESDGHLAEVARRDPSAEVRRTALLRIRDPKLRAEIGLADPVGGVRVAAAETLEDPVLLAKTAREDRDAGVRAAAVSRITDQSVLAGIAAQEKNLFVRRAAIPRVTDPEVRFSLILTAGTEDQRAGALEKLPSDDPRLLDIALKDMSPGVRAAAVGRMDRSMAAEIAVRGEGQARTAALERLTAREELLPVARKAMDSEAVRARLASLGFTDETFLLEALSGAEGGARERLALELDKLRFLEELRAAGEEELLAAYTGQKVQDLKNHPGRNAIRAAVLLLREFGVRQEPGYYEGAPSGTACAVKEFLTRQYGRYPELAADIREANRYSVMHHLDNGSTSLSCHDDEGPVHFDFA